jgi:hypothetical protein
MGLGKLANLVVGIIMANAITLLTVSLTWIIYKPHFGFSLLIILIM